MVLSMMSCVRAYTFATLETLAWFKRALSPLNLCSFHSIHKDAIEGLQGVNCVSILPD